MKKPWGRVARATRLERVYVFKHMPQEPTFEEANEMLKGNGIPCCVYYSTPIGDAFINEHGMGYFLNKGKVKVKTPLGFLGEAISADKVNAENSLIANIIIDCEWEIRQKTAQVAENRDLDPSRPHVWVPKGDGFAFTKQRFASVARLDAQARQEIIHRREHYVRGHWRTYRNGHRVWVHAHRRGDPSLGSLITVQSIEGV